MREGSPQALAVSEAWQSFLPQDSRTLSQVLPTNSPFLLKPTRPPGQEPGLSMCHHPAPATWLPAVTCVGQVPTLQTLGCCPPLAWNVFCCLPILSGLAQSPPRSPPLLTGVPPRAFLCCRTLVLSSFSASVSPA